MSTISKTKEPLLSVVITTPSSHESIRLVIRHLRAQAVKDRIELIVVGPAKEAIEPLKEELSVFWGYKLLAIGPITSIGRANAAGIRAATAEIVALAEDHCFPAPDWAEAMIAAHHGPWAAVGPVMRNANPQSAVSWSDFVIGYGPWMHPAAAGEAPFLPGHNSCYKKPVLLDYGNRLEDMMQAETVLHMDLRRRGCRLYLEPQAQVMHINFSLASSWLPVQFHAGRVFAASRAGQWGAAKKIFYFAASPLIPFVRLWRCLRELTRPGRRPSIFAQVVPVLCLGLAVDGIGQMMGYLFGAANSIERLSEYEFHRFRHVPASERLAAERLIPTSS